MKIGCQIYTSETLPFMRVVKKMLHTQKKRPQCPFQAEGCCYCTVVQQRRSHCDSQQGLGPLSPWMTCLPTYLAGREVFGVGGVGGEGVCTARGMGCD